MSGIHDNIDRNERQTSLEDIMRQWPLLSPQQQWAVSTLVAAYTAAMHDPCQLALSLKPSLDRP
jgi:hypothetical protein